MLKNYFRIAWRNLVSSKLYAVINIAGLATGMAMTLLIGLWVWDELSFDSYHANYRQLSQILLSQSAKGETDIGGTIAMPLGEALHSKYGDDFKKVSLVSFSDNHIVNVGDKRITASGIWAQPDFPEMFTLQMDYGNRNVLRDPSTCLISTSLALTLFGHSNPVNKLVRLDNKLVLKVGGVYRDLPANTSFFGTRVLLPWSNKENGYLNSNKDWDDHNGQLFAELADGVTADQATAKIRNVPTPFIKGWHEEVLAYPLSKMHLYGEFKNGKPEGGRIQYVRLFMIIGIFILLLACINFMNLSTARSAKRAKEVGIRKTIGSLRIQLIRQFLVESILVAVLAFLLSLALALLALPFFNGLSGKYMNIGWTNPWFWLPALAVTLLTGIISGSYPAFYLSAFRPIKVLKGNFRSGRYAAIPRKALVVLQFTVSITLIVGTLMIFRQIEFARDRPVGYSREGLITVPINTEDLYGHHEAIKSDLLRTGFVENVAQSSQTTTGFNNNNELYWRGKTPDQESIFFRNVNVTPEFGQTIGWTLVDGHDFTGDYAMDSSAMILNEAAVKIIGIKNPVGERMKFGGRERVVIGVVKNMLTNSPYEDIEPALFIRDPYFAAITIRIKKGKPMQSALAAIEPVFKKYNPGSPFLFSFNDEDYAKKFSAEQRIGKLAGFFTAFAIFISCLGLFGLASFVAEQKTKEIGIRKVLGASVISLWRLLSGEFFALVLISLFIAVPVGYYFMYEWLQHYPYHAAISGWIFVAAGSGALIITLLTVSAQSIRAALTNPVSSLRSE